ncbi:Gfo/Idh/MocA family oxidoreductase [Halobacteria archaeon AArc-dxtr1]|nr:Gfo/Idh/MocA family oxidoreductase [Halobacteria archaeon AArc-dxtr1]
MPIENVFEDFQRRDWERRSPEGTVRLAIVGVGHFARTRALPAIKSATYCETTVLVTESSEHAAETADEFDVSHVLDYDAFLSGERADAYDAVYIATPNALHDRYTLAGAEHGKHVLCEKPLTVDRDRGRELVEACDQAGVTLMTAYRLQMEPTVRRSRELIADGALGDIVHVHGGFSHPLLEYTDSDTWRLDPEIAGGGALVDLGIYPINTTRYVLGDDPAAVYASTHSSGGPFAAVDEHVSVQLEFPSGAMAACTASFDAHASSQLQFVGTDGMLSIASPFGGVVPQEIVAESGDMRMEYTGPPVDEVEEEFDYFGYCVLTGTRPEPDGEDGLADIKIIETAYEAAETGRRIELE